MENEIVGIVGNCSHAENVVRKNCGLVPQPATKMLGAIVNRKNCASLLAIMVVAGAVLVDFPVRQALSASQIDRNLVTILDARVLNEDSEFRAELSISSPFWTPTVDEVQLLESKILDVLRLSEDERIVKISENMSEYRRQYAGYTEKGRQVILVNGFCRDHWPIANYWHQFLVFVYDGGACFFRIRYDVSLRKFGRPELNNE